MCTFSESPKILEPPLEPLSHLRMQTIKKRVGRLARITWFLRVGVAGFEPAT
ncbi:hypothetical protein EV02_1905 [Prochlorococcus marinus str. SB]|uniref:Uncharacterized protein n=1 Tax=Prochlorococcus marinus str. SB TaxID=59926 RepID=A0A0A2B8V4_PROMR|nr:hypothetical protein EV02_1905 [Prochlorococcus marinus str. SB]